MTKEKMLCPYCGKDHLDFMDKYNDPCNGEFAECQWCMKEFVYEFLNQGSSPRFFMTWKTMDDYNKDYDNDKIPRLDKEYLIGNILMEMISDSEKVEKISRIIYNYEDYLSEL